MKIVINNPESEYVETFSFDILDNFEDTFKKISSMKGTIGLSGTMSFPDESIDILEPPSGSIMCSNSMIDLYN